MPRRCAPSTPPIAVLDTGVDPAVPELAGRVLPGANVTNGTTNTADNDAHGTEVASVAAGRLGRFQGVSPTSPILPISIYTASSETTASWVVKAIQTAVARGAAVINISSSNPKDDVQQADSDVLQQAILAAFDAGTITVAAIGNEGKGAATVPSTLSRVIAVGSSSLDGTRDAFSNFGPALDVVSPGASLSLPAPAGVCISGYGNANGTSFSAPAVAGAAALIKALRPQLSAGQLYDIMRLSAVKDLYGAGRDDDSGFGLLDVAAGAAAPAPAKDATELDDDVFWLKQNPKRHPRQLTRKRLLRLKSAVAAGKDPQDVVPVYVRRGETLTASVSSGKNGLLDVGIWSAKTGSFDISKSRTTYLLADASGVTNSPVVRYRSKRSSTLYVSVEAPDPLDASDPQSGTTAVEAQTKYTLTLRKTRASKKSKKKRTR